MRKWLAVAVLVLGGCSSGGCACKEIHPDIVEVRKLHTAYRSATVPRPGLEAAKVEELAGKIDGALAKMEELTGE